MTDTITDLMLSRVRVAVPPETKAVIDSLMQSPMRGKFDKLLQSLASQEFTNEQLAAYIQENVLAPYGRYAINSMLRQTVGGGEVLTITHPPESPVKGSYTVGLINHTHYEILVVPATDSPDDTDGRLARYITQVCIESGGLHGIDNREVKEITGGREVLATGTPLLNKRGSLVQAPVVLAYENHHQLLVFEIAEVDGSFNNRPAFLRDIEN